MPIAWRTGSSSSVALVFVSGLAGNVIELTPPLTISEAEVDEGLELFEQALADVEAGRFDDAKLAPFAGW